MREDIDQAETWYKKSLEIHMARGSLTGLARPLYALGLLAEDRGRHEEALERTVECVGLFDEFPHPSTDSAAKLLAR
jgi:hypothetical protein